MKNVEENKREMNGNLEVGGVDWYRGKIIDMVRQLENLDYLKFIYDIMIAFKRRWGI